MVPNEEKNASNEGKDETVESPSERQSGTLPSRGSSGSLVGENLCESGNDGVATSTDGSSMPSPEPDTRSARRPPRCPTEIPIPRVMRDRRTSTGDDSVLSELSIEGQLHSSPEKKPNAHHHNRTVSWAQDFSDAAQTSNSPILQPILGGQEHPLLSNQRLPSKRFTLDDYNRANPHESEAERNILRAVEEAQAEEHRRRASSVTNILPHLPDEGIGIFEASPQVPPSSSNDEEQTMASNVTKGHRRLVSNFSQRGLRERTHAPRDRNQSLEFTLLDLTTAMREMNESEALQNPAQEHQGEEHEQEVPTSSADALIHNANIVFRKHLVDDAASVPSETPESPDRVGPIPRQASRWNLFGGDSPGHPKKTDQGDLTDVPEGSEDTSSEGDKDNEPDIEQGMSSPSSPRHKKFKFGKSVLKRAGYGAKYDLEAFSDFLRPKKASIHLYCKTVLLYVFLPAVAVSAILYYGTGNPILRKTGASISWLILFLIRQIVCFTLAKASELFLIDFLSLQTRYMVQILGPVMTLVLVQSKGFPFIVVSWGILSLLLLSGSHAFANHWLYWQDLIGMCEESNPSGGIPDSDVNYRVLCSLIAIGVAVTAKRVWLGLYFGKRTLGECA